MNLQDISCQRCLTASGWLVRDYKILLVKHKMLGIWLAPGGHVELNELPHQAAEREFLEETGVRVQAISALPNLNAQETEFLPVPCLSNLHWINKPGEVKKVRKSTNTACEQHYVFGYFVKCVDACEIKNQDDGIEDVRWFSLEEALELNTLLDVREEMKFVFANFPQEV